MNEDMSDLPQAIAADPDGVQVALRAARALWSRGDTTESLKWLRKAAESASDEGADTRSLQLAKAAAELRVKLLGGSEPPARSLQGGSALAAAPASGAHAALASGSFPPSDVAPGESGSHPIAPSRARSESEPPRTVRSSSTPPLEALVAGAASDAGPGGLSSRPITATQYPSPRPRQRMGLQSAPPPSTRESTAYASVPSWSADSERRPSGAPPPLPRANLDDYEELEAEPDDEPADDEPADDGAADDPGSAWSGAGPESWRPADEADGGPASRGAVASAAAARATPPPLPHGGAFADDDSDFTQQTEAHTVVLPSHQEEPDAEPPSLRERRPAAAAFGGAPSNAWDQESRVPSWDHVGGSSWAADLHQSTWGHPPGQDNGGSEEPLSPDVATQSEAARAKLTARVHHQAVRVSFAPDLRVPGQYVVRPLREGEKAATGERVALLVALEPGMPLV